MSVMTRRAFDISESFGFVNNKVFFGCQPSTERSEDDWPEKLICI